MLRELLPRNTTTTTQIKKKQNTHSHEQQHLSYTQASYEQRMFLNHLPIQSVLGRNICLHVLQLTGAVLWMWHMRSCAIHNSFASYETSFVLVTLRRLIVSEPKHWVTWSHRTGVNFPFLRGKRIEYFVSASSHHF